MGAWIAAAFGILLALEWKRPLRRANEDKLRRDTRNLIIAGIGGVVMAAAERPAVARVAALAERRGWGLVRRARLPRALAVAAGVLLLDYTLYLWHVLTHKVPFLWRFHLVHHVDLDLDASTALRFHFGELALSVPYRAAQVVVFGVDEATYRLWNNLLLLSILFHHSNVRLNARVERVLGRIIVTPRLHGIHHDADRAHTDSNWSSGLSIWDRLHGTFRADVPQREVIVGIPAYRDPSELTTAACLALPFREQRKAWNPPAISVPVRES